MATIKDFWVASSAILGFTKSKWLNGQGPKNTIKNLCILTEGVGHEEGAEDWLIWHDDMLVWLIYSELVKVKSTHFCPSLRVPTWPLLQQWWWMHPRLTSSDKFSKLDQLQSLRDQPTLSNGPVMTSQEPLGAMGRHDSVRTRAFEKTEVTRWLHICTMQSTFLNVFKSRPPRPELRSMSHGRRG